MKRALVLMIAMGLGVPARGQQTSAPSPPDQEFQTGTLELGLQQVGIDTISSKFFEYRDVPNGVVAPFFRLFGKNDKIRYNLIGQNVQRGDQRYFFNLEGSKIRIAGQFNVIPHRFGNNGVTLLQTTTSRGTLEISDTLQAATQGAIERQFAASPASVNYAFLNGLVSPSLAAGNPVDLALKRQRSNLDISLTPDKAYDVRVTYFHEKRSGDRASAGTSFGFGNVVETPEPVGYLTQDIGASAQLDKKWGVVRGTVHYNWFENSISTLAWDNPFRVTDSTDPSAYTGPASGSINGPRYGLMALPPENSAVNAALGTTLKLKHNTRVTADFSFGFWKQNQTPFIAYTTNTAITSPLNAANPSTLPAQQLDGDMTTTSQVVSLTSRPADRLTFRAQFRRYDLSNQTSRITFPGYVRFDAVWEDIGRISVPYGYTNDRFDALASFDLGPVTIEGGYRYTGFERTFRETEKTTENALNVSADVRKGWVLARASYERASRDFDAYEFERSEEASHTSPGDPANLPQLLRFDQAPRNVDRVGATLQLTPTGAVMVALNYFYNMEDFHDTSYGLKETKWSSFSGDVDYTPGDRLNLFGYYSREGLSSLQGARQSAATPSTDPRNDWTADLTDDVDTFGAGATIGIVPEKIKLRLDGRYQKVNGNADLASPPGGTPDLAFGIPNVDDTKLGTFLAQVEYQFAPRWTFTLGGWVEDYEFDDAFTAVGKNYYPGSFFLSANDGNYFAKVGFVRLTYRW